MKILMSSSVLRGQLQLMKSEFKLRDNDLRDGELWTWRNVVEYVKNYVDLKNGCYQKLLK